jgi:protein TonB
MATRYPSCRLLAFLLSLGIHGALALVLSLVVLTQSEHLGELFTADLVSVPQTSVKPRVVPRQTPPSKLASPRPIAATFVPPGPVVVVTPDHALTTIAAPSSDAPTPLVGPALARTAAVPPPAVAAYAPRPALATPRPAPGKHPVPSRFVDVRPHDGLAGLTSFILQPPAQRSPETLASIEFLAKVRQRIERAKRYPRFARDSGIEGTAKVRFELRRNGMLASVRVVESSGSKVLDDAAATAIRDAAPFPPFPAEQKDDILPMEIAIVFQLTDGRE